MKIETLDKPLEEEERQISFNDDSTFVNKIITNIRKNFSFVTT